MAGLFERVVKTLGYERTPSSIEAEEIVKQQIFTPSEDPDGRSVPPDYDIEIGDPGSDTWAELYKAIPYPMDPMDIRVYSDMRYGNGTCAAMIKVLQLPILATKWNLSPGPNDEDGSIAAFINDCLSLGGYEGGMEIPMQQVIYELTSSFWAGYKPMEIVWKVVDGKVVIRKIAPRSPLTTKPVVDAHGNLVGAFQKSTYMSSSRTVFIPREKLLWYAHRMEDGNWYGESDFRTAYVHYETLRKLYIIDNKTHEVTAIPIRVAQPTMGGFTQTQKDEVFRKIKRVGLDTAILLPKDVSLTEFGAKSAAGSTRSESIDHHTTQMAMSILAHFTQLGTNGQGTYNLSQDQSDFFLTMVTAEMRSIAAVITESVVAPLVKLNYGDRPGIIPKFTFSDMTDHVKKVIESIFLAIVQGGGQRLSDEFIESLGKRISVELGLDLTTLARNDDGTPSATRSQEDLDEQALAKFEAQANATGAMKAGPGAGNTSGGANQVIAAARKEDNKGTSKANMSSSEILQTLESSDNARDFFGRLKLKMSNVRGINAPQTPSEVSEYLDTVDLSDIGSVNKIVNLASELVSSWKEVEDE